MIRSTLVFIALYIHHFTCYICPLPCFCCIVTYKVNNLKISAILLMHFLKRTLSARGINIGWHSDALYAFLGLCV